MACFCIALRRAVLDMFEIRLMRAVLDMAYFLFGIRVMRGRNEAIKLYNLRHHVEWNDDGVAQA